MHHSQDLGKAYVSIDNAFEQREIFIYHRCCAANLLLLCDHHVYNCRLWSVIPRDSFSIMHGPDLFIVLQETFLRQRMLNGLAFPLHNVLPSVPHSVDRCSASSSLWALHQFLGPWFLRSMRLWHHKLRLARNWTRFLKRIFQLSQGK